MTWLFSKALMKDYENSHCSQAREAGFSADTCSDGEPYAQLNVMPTPHKFWRNDKTMDVSRLSQFGLTLRLLTETHGVDLLMWYREVSLARTSAQLARVQVSTESEADFGPKWQGSFAKYDPDMYLWRTPQCSLLGDSDEFLETWPRWGSMRNGVSYLRPIPELPICVSGSGFWPTPCASDNSDRKVSNSVHITSNGIPKHVAANGVMSQMRLSQAVKMWPTPNASDANKWSNQSLAERKEKGQQVRLNTAVSPEGGKGGLLNPEWVEWLMSWSIGWTDLKPLATVRFHEWLQQHSISFTHSEKS